MNTNKKSLYNLITYALLIIGFLIIMSLTTMKLTSRHFNSLLVPICVNIILAISLNLVVGFLGELSLGHAGFMSIGAYAGCLFSIYTQNIFSVSIRFPLALLFGGIVASLFGLIIGIPVLRLKGDYLAIVTLAFGEILRSVIINLNFTGGASGLKGTPQDSTFVIAFILVMITLFFITNLVDSKYGRTIMSLRDNRIASEACGINANYYKLVTFIISAFFAGIAGVLYGHNFSILDAGTFGYNKSIEILVIVVLGGMGNIRGSIISAIIITILPEILRFSSDYRMLIYSLVLIAMMLFSSSPSFESLRISLDFKQKHTLKNDKKINGGEVNE